MVCSDSAARSPRVSGRLLSVATALAFITLPPLMALAVAATPPGATAAVDELHAQAVTAPDVVAVSGTAVLVGERGHAAGGEQGLHVGVDREDGEAPGAEARTELVRGGLASVLGDAAGGLVVAQAPTPTGSPGPSGPAPLPCVPQVVAPDRPGGGDVLLLERLDVEVGTLAELNPPRVLLPLSYAPRDPRRVLRPVLTWDIAVDQPPPGPDHIYGVVPLCVPGGAPDDGGGEPLDGGMQGDDCGGPGGGPTEAVHVAVVESPRGSGCWYLDLSPEPCLPTAITFGLVRVFEARS